MVKNLKCIFNNIKEKNKINRKIKNNYTYIMFNNTILRVSLDTFSYYNSDEKGRSR